jgi:hypothetical protein
MGIFDFLKPSKNIKNDNGVNEIYFDNGKSAQIQSRFMTKNGKRHGEFENFYENGLISLKGEFKNGLQHGKATSYTLKGVLFRESNFKKNKHIGFTKEFYSNGKLRFEYDTEKDKYTFYSKKGKKTLIAYIEIYENLMSHISRSSHPKIYKTEVVNPEKNGIQNRIVNKPFGTWKIFNDIEEIEYELDFKLLSNSFFIETVQKKYFNKSGETISSEMLDISKLNTKYFSYDNINERKDKLIDFNVKIDNVIKLKKIEIKHKILESFIQESNDSKIYAFDRHYCAMKVMFEIMIFNGGIDSYKDLSDIMNKSKSGDKSYWEIERCFKNDYLSIEYKYVQGKYSVNKTSFHGVTFSQDLPHILIIKDIN